MCYLNIRSIVNKINVFQSFVYCTFPDIIGVTETWLSDKIFNNEILPQNYSIIRKDRQSRGGGVMFAIKHSKSYQVLLSPPDLELLTISIGSPTSTIYCLVYIPPNSPDEYIQKYFNYIISLNDMTQNLVLLGDFNFKDINWDSLIGTTPLSIKFCDIIFNLNLTQLINQPTHIAGNILDLILTSSPDSISNLHIHDNLPLSIPSDHYIITFDIAASPVHSKTKGQIHLLNFSKGDYEGLCYFLSTVDLSLCFQSEDIEFIWSFLNNLIGDAINKFVPISSISHNKQPIWFNSNIRHHIKCLRTLRRKFNKRPTDNNKMKYENSSNLLQAKITSAKANYESDLITAFANNNNPRVHQESNKVPHNSSHVTLQLQNC